MSSESQSGQGFGAEIPPGLQFDRVEPGHPGAGEAAAGLTAQRCERCRQLLSGVYYEVDGKLTCTICRERAEVDWQSGSGLARFGKALSAGVGAAIAGAILYYGVRALTGYELSIIAIAVGVMVGKAVLWGTAGRSGKGYQVLAVLLTYLAIGGTFLPAAFEGMQTAARRKAAATASPTAGAKGGAAPAAPAAGSSSVAEPNLGLGQIFTGLFAILMLTAALPVLVGMKSPILLLILGIGLFEAWKTSRPKPLQVDGPFTLAS